MRLNLLIPGCRHGSREAMSVSMHVMKPQLDHEVIKQALKDFYSIHNASRISSIDTIVESYLGKEVELLEELKKRYKVEFEPFKIILSQLRFNQSNELENEALSTSIADDHQGVTGAAATHPLKRDESSATQPQTSATRSSLSALGLPTLFTDKLMNGVNWKGFSMESSTVAVDTKKENEIPENEEKLIDFAALARETNHPEELLMQIQKSLEQFSHLEKCVKLSLKKLDALNIPTSKVSSRKSDGISLDVDMDAESAKDLDGRLQDSLKMEILSLRELVDNMRNYIFESMQTRNFYEDKQNSQQVGQDRQETVDVQKSFDNGNSNDSSTNRDISDVYQNKVFDTAHIDKLSALKKSLSVNWKEQDELRFRIYELSLENEALRQSMLAKDSLIRDRDSITLQLQREIKDLEEQLRQSNLNKNELLQLNESKISSMEKQFKEHVNLIQERLFLEQEDALAHIVSVAEAQQAWQATLSQEAQTEIIRLRVELAKSRRQESQRDREVAYLQRQLTEAAKQLAQYVVESEDADRGNE